MLGAKHVFEVSEEVPFLNAEEARLLLQNGQSYEVQFPIVNIRFIKQSQSFFELIEI